MTWRPHMLALDIDGTLVDGAGNLPPEIYEGVQRALAAGVKVVLATGRGWRDTQPVFDQLDLPPGLAVSSNGAVLVEHPPTRIIREVTFDPRDVLTRVAREAPQALVAVEDVGRGYRVTNSVDWPPNELAGEITVCSMAELASAPVSRVVVRDPRSSDQAFFDLAHKLGLEGVSYTIGYSAWLDIAPEGINKASALADVCSRLGIQRRDVLALGDGRNDIEMLQWAGRGVAIGDAPPEVKEAADAVTGKFADGGTADELSRWF